MGIAGQSGFPAGHGEARVPVRAGFRVRRTGTSVLSAGEGGLARLSYRRKKHLIWRKVMNTFKCSAAVLIAVLLLPNVATSADAAKVAYEKSMACLQKGDYDSAIAALTEAIRLEP